MIGPFGRYQLLKLIGIGGMAEVYLGRSHTLDGFEKDVVIKCIRADLTDDEQFVSMFIEEGRITIGLSHPNIVQVFDFGQVDQTYYLAMEFVHGCDLQTLLSLAELKGCGLPPPLALLIAAEILKGLDYAHNQTGRDGQPQALIHRDISPENIMLSLAGAVKVADFGIAKRKRRVTETQPHMLVGKVAYMAPEQVAQQPLDGRCDVFAAGVVLWEMLLGKPMYEGNTEQLMTRARHAQVDPPSSVNPDLPAELNALVMRALARDLDARYASARDFGQAIHSYLARHHPDVDIYALTAFLARRRVLLKVLDMRDIDALDAKVTHPLDASAPALSAMPARTLRHPSQHDTGLALSPQLRAAVAVFRARPNLWQLVEIGDMARRESLLDVGLGFFQAAAVKFAQRGLLAQSLLCCRRMLMVQPSDGVRASVMALSTMRNRSDADVAQFFFPGDGPMESLLTELFAATEPARGLAPAVTPLLSAVGPEAFAALAELAPLRVFDQGATIVREGEAGQTMYLMGMGRVLVYAADALGSRVYLSAMSAGDFFGENSFFTRAPRSATVEAVEHVEAFEIDQDLYDTLMAGTPQASGVLLQFYKERIVDALLAKSPVFGLLPTEARRELVGMFSLREFAAGAVIIEEGDPSDNIFLIKNGHAEVSTSKGGPRTHLSTIGPGSLFGEVAAVRHISRTARVTAKTPLEALELTGVAFDGVLHAWPEVRQRVMDVLAQRARENIDKLLGPSPFARSRA